MSDSEDTILTCERSAPGQRLDSFLSERLPHVSRGAIRRLIEQEYIQVHEHPVKPSYHPQPGDVIRIHWPPPTPSSVEPEVIPLEVLFEDEALLVINKAPGLVVHPSAGHASGTLVNALLHHCRGRLSGIGGVARPGIVHRLDLDTSGCMVVAKHDQAHVSLAEQFAARTVAKAYHAIVCGALQPEVGEIRVAIARHPTHRKRMAAVDGRGRDAWTSYRVLASLRGATWVEAALHTGRTHQVRVHFKHLGSPLVGDATYGNRQNKRLKEETGYQASRQMLHAASLGFVHPASGERMVFTAPTPADFQEALAALRLGSGV